MSKIHPKMPLAAKHLIENLNKEILFSSEPEFYYVIGGIILSFLKQGRFWEAHYMIELGNFLKINAEQMGEDQTRAHEVLRKILETAIADKDHNLIWKEEIEFKQRQEEETPRTKGRKHTLDLADRDAKDDIFHSLSLLEVAKIAHKEFEYIFY